MWLVCKTFLAKMSFICMRIKKSLLYQWLHSLALKKRLGQLENGLFDTTCTRLTHIFQPSIHPKRIFHLMKAQVYRVTMPSEHEEEARVKVESKRRMLIHV